MKELWKKALDVNNLRKLRRIPTEEYNRLRKLRKGTTRKQTLEIDYEKEFESFLEPYIDQAESLK